MIKGDVILTRGTSKINDIIAKLSEDNGSRWGHVAFAISNDRIIEADWDGVVMRTKSQFMKTIKEFVICRPLTSKVNVNKLTKDIQNELGVKYSFLQLVIDGVCLLGSKIFGKDLRKEFSYDPAGTVCSELVARAFLKQRLWIVKDILPPYVEPEEFYRCKGLFTIGKVNEDMK
jgi:hypothetical protein